jgi:hypothetical protein
MKPKDLVTLRVREYVLDLLNSRGFRFFASKLRFSRTVGNACQHIDISLSKWNREDDATFWSIWGATAPYYVEWHFSQWGKAPVNSALGGRSDWNIPGWTRSAADHFHLLGTTADAAEMGDFFRNIEGPGLQYLDSISTREGAAQQLREERWMFDRSSDFYMIAEKPNEAYSTLVEGIDTFEVQKRPDNFNELPGLRARLQRYFPERCAQDNVK